MDQRFYALVDVLGTFAFATSGAAAAKQRRLDWFGIFAVAYLTACGGGIVRDVCLGSVPPVGVSEWRYMACSSLASVMTARQGG